MQNSGEMNSIIWDLKPYFKPRAVEPQLLENEFNGEYFVK